MEVELKISEVSYIAMGSCRANANNTAMRCIGMRVC